MNSKIAFFFLVAFFFVQFVAASPRTVRDAPEEKDALGQAKDKIDAFLKDNLQFDKLIEGLSEKMKELGGLMENGAKDLAKNFQKKEEN